MKKIKIQFPVTDNTVDMIKHYKKEFSLELIICP